MSHQTRNTVILLILFFFIAIGGGYYILIHQPKDIKAKIDQLNELNQTFTDTKALGVIYDSLSRESERIDSILFNRTKAIPFRESMTDTYNDIIRISKHFSQYTRMDIEFEQTESAGAASIDLFNLSGQGDFIDVFKLLYELEKSKKLYKIKSVNLKNATLTKGSGEILYQVLFNIKLESYFTTDKNLALNYEETVDKKYHLISDYFYPLITPEIPPNYDELLEVEGASLLAIIPDGVFIMDKNGNSYTLNEGDPVYLGYLTKIDYDRQKCEFTLNRGGIVEKIILELKSFNIKETKQ
jgi:hypothetical protein